MLIIFHLYISFNRESRTVCTPVGQVQPAWTVNQSDRRRHAFANTGTMPIHANSIQYIKRSQLQTSPSQISWNQHKTGIYFVKFRPHTNYLEYSRYKQHKTDFEVIPTDRPILLPCKQKGCKCVSYNYVPMNGSQPIRCTCKHTSEEHFEFDPFICKRSKA